MIYRTLTQATILRRGLRNRHFVSTLVDPGKAIFEHVCVNCGFIFREQLLVGPTGERKPASPDACRLMARTWAGYGESGGICPLCSDPASPTARRIAAENRRRGP